jgi:competence protein ComEC
LTAGIFYFFFEPRIRTRRGRAAILIVFCLNIFLAQEIVRETARRSKMTMLDVGQGDSVYFEFAKGGNLLVDAGGARFSDKGRSVLMPFLRSKGVRCLDAVVISHPQEDHVGGLMTVLEEFKIKSVMTSGRPYGSQLWKNMGRRIAAEGSDQRKVSRGDEIRGYPEASLQVLHPVRDAAPDKNINNDCVVLKIKDGQNSVLMTGDIEEEAMKDILNSGRDLKADVLKVPHHGAKLKAGGLAFVQAVSPAVSLISVGERNPFHHPRPETLSALESIAGNRVLRTDKEGAISLDL